jgi:hypothetical protein
MHVTRNSGNGYGNIVLTDGAMADMEGSGTLMVRQYVDDVVRTSSPSQSSPTLGPSSCMTHQHQHQRSGTHSSSGSGPGSCNSSFLGADSNFSAGTLHYLTVHICVHVFTRAYVSRCSLRYTYLRTKALEFFLKTCSFYILEDFHRYYLPVHLDFHVLFFIYSYLNVLHFYG